jgi:hypothetical protein
MPCATASDADTARSRPVRMIAFFMVFLRKTMLLGDAAFAS